MTDASGQMRCESVEDRLLDLVYGDLDEAEARDVRAHAEACEGCRRSLARLEGGRALARHMPVSDPGADVLASVRAAARAQAAEIAAAAAQRTDAGGAGDAGEQTESRPAPVEAAPDRGGWWSDLLRWLGSMAMGPQVAMATLLMLMIGIGLWSLPSLRGRSGRDAGAIVEPDPAGEVGPSRALEPAEPLAFDFDPRTRRLAPVGEGGAAQQTSGAGARPAASSTPRPSAPAPGALPTERRAAAAVDLEADDRRARAREVAPLDEDSARDEAPGRAEPASEALALAVEGELAPGEALGELDDPAPAPERPSAAAGGYAAVEAQRAPAPSTAPPVAPSAPEARDEVARPTADAESALASALHHQARDAAARGAHAECARQYQALLSRYPRYAETGRALVELADCQRRSGRLGDARRTLERAERIPSVRADATRELARVRAMEERAADIDRAPAAQPAEAY